MITEKKKQKNSPVSVVYNYYSLICRP